MLGRKFKKIYKGQLIIGTMSFHTSKLILLFEKLNFRNMNDEITNGDDQILEIGSQLWMTSNLEVKTFSNGDVILEAQNGEEWRDAGEKGIPAWCYYDNDVNNENEYGILYNWHAVNDDRSLAPDGFFIPSDKDWTQLIDFLGGEDVAVGEGGLCFDTAHMQYRKDKETLHKHIVEPKPRIAAGD